MGSSASEPQDTYVQAQNARREAAEAQKRHVLAEIDVVRYRIHGRSSSIVNKLGLLCDESTSLPFSCEACALPRGARRDGMTWI